MNSVDVQLPKGIPINKFVPFKDGYVFVVIPASGDVNVVATEREDYSLNIVNVYDLTIGKGGVLCGMYFTTSQTVVALPNALYVYRNKLANTNTKALLSDPGTRFQLNYRPMSGRGVPMLRIFTLGTDLVVIGSDLFDVMKSKLESQD